eukprot:gene7826-9295_t
MAKDIAVDYSNFVSLPQWLSVIRGEEEFTVSGAKIKEESIAGLCDAMKEVGPKLHTLNFTMSGLDIAGAGILAETLKSPECHLTTLNLLVNQIRAEGAASLADALASQNCKLQTLSLVGNEMGSAGVSHLAEAMTNSHCRLVTLNLSGNDIGDRGAASLAETLTSDCCLLKTLNATSDLWRAACGGDMASVQALLGVDPNDPEESLEGGVAPLCAAAGAGHVQVVTALLSKGADVDAQDDMGRTALHAAAGGGYADVVAVLLTASAHRDICMFEKGWTPLHHAAWEGHENMVKALLEAGALVEATSTKHWTPLHFAAIHGYVDVVKALLHGAAKAEARTDTEVATLQREWWGKVNMVPSVWSNMQCGQKSDAMTRIKEYLDDIGGGGGGGGGRGDVDTFVVSFAGRGMSGTGNWLFPGGGGSMALGDVLNEWTKSQARRRQPPGLLVLVLDCCHSGAWVQEAAALKLSDVVMQASCRRDESHVSRSGGGLPGFWDVYARFQLGGLSRTGAIEDLLKTSRPGEFSRPGECSMTPMVYTMWEKSHRGVDAILFEDVPGTRSAQPRALKLLYAEECDDE